MFDSAIKLINGAQKITVVQAENPDGDSLGSALALEEILGDIGKEVYLYCPVEIPKYLRYIKGWDRVQKDFDLSAELIIIVDTSTDILLGKMFDNASNRALLAKQPVLLIDHHALEKTPEFAHTLLIKNTVATSEIVYQLAIKANWKINQVAAENIMIAIMSDSLGLTTQSVTPETYFTLGKLAELGANNSTIEERRRELMKKSPEILKYKGELIGRIEYYLDGVLSLIYIPWEDIQKYSDQYNPSVLVLDEMRLVEKVQIGIAIKTYPDGKLTGKIRTNIPVASTVAGYFGGGGHEYAAGFRIYESYDKVLHELINVCDKIIRGYK